MLCCNICVYGACVRACVPVSVCGVRVRALQSLKGRLQHAHPHCVCHACLWLSRMSVHTCRLSGLSRSDKMVLCFLPTCLPCPAHVCAVLRCAVCVQLDPAVLLPLLFKLFRVNDKQLRELLFRHIISGM